MNSTTKIIAGVAVLALLFAGIGFAIDYKATTDSTENEIGVAYIVLNDAASGSNAKLITESKLVFDTATDTAGAVTFTYDEEDSEIGEGVIHVVNKGATVNATFKITCNAALQNQPAFEASKFTVSFKDGAAVSYSEGWESAPIEIAEGSSDINIQFALIDPPASIEDADKLSGTFSFKIEATAVPTA